MDVDVEGEGASSGLKGLLEDDDQALSLSAFETLEKEFQDVLATLAGDESLDEFRAEYDGSWFDSANELDYCSPSGFGSAAQPNAVDWCEGADVTEDHGGHDPRTVDDEVGKPGSGLVD